MEHGQKQLACTAGLLLYFSADEDARRVYRRWAQDVAEGYEPVDGVPEDVEAALQRQFCKKLLPRKRKR